MSTVVGDDATHADGGSTVQQTLSHHGVGLGDTLDRAGHGQDSVMYTGDDLADAGLDAGLIAKVGDVLAGLADDDAGLLGGDDGTKGQLRLGVLVVGLGRTGSVGAGAQLTGRGGRIGQADTIERVGEGHAVVRATAVVAGVGGGHRRCGPGLA